MNISNDDVLHFTTNVYPMPEGSIISTVDGVLEALHENISDNVWTHDGVECLYLNTQGGGWKKGKVHIRLEFVPDEDAQQKDERQIISSELNKIRNSL